MFISWGTPTCRRLCLEAALASKAGVCRSRLGEKEFQASELLVVRDSKALPLHQDAAVQDRSGFEASVKEGAMRSSELGALGRLWLVHYFLILSKKRFSVG